jgi:hypothetical protein
MRHVPDEPSAIWIASGGDLGDYAFHEFRDVDEWFVEESPDGQPRWEELPRSHPLSQKPLVTPPMLALPPIPRLVRPLLERTGVRVTLVALLCFSAVGLVSLGTSSDASPRHALAASTAASTDLANLPVTPPEPMAAPAPSTSPPVARVRRSKVRRANGKPSRRKVARRTAQRWD